MQIHALSFLHFLVNNPVIGYVKLSPLAKTPNYMFDFHSEKKLKSFKIDLISSAKGIQKLVQPFLQHHYCWKVLSGKWELELSNKIIGSKEPNAKMGENIAIFGSPSWNDFTLQVRFRLLTDSMKPPEGGAILYFHFKNIKNFYSFHFCLFKQKIEFIKRYRGIWSIIAEQDCDFETQKDYWITISTNSGIYKCQRDETDLMEISDRDISKGYLGIGAKYCDIEFGLVSISMH